MKKERARYINTSDNAGFYSGSMYFRRLPDYTLAWRKPAGVLFGAVIFVWSVVTTAQEPAENHLEHHVEQTDAPAETTSVSVDMMESMQQMMREMLSPPRKELYPALLELSGLTDDQRGELLESAGESMRTGMVLLSEGTALLAQATESDDYAAMREALLLMREGIARFNSGVATEQAIAANNQPQEVALQWFRQEMNLPQPLFDETQSAIWGFSRFHFSLILSFVLFASALTWLYFLRMRRATRLLNELAGTSVSSLAADHPAKPFERSAEVADMAPAALTKSGKKWSGQLRVGRIFQETPDVKTFRFMNPLGGVLPFQYLPGQFITVTVPTDDKPVRRSYTIASSPTQHDYIDLTIKHNPGGLVSGHMHSSVRQGDLLDFSGPSGAFVFTGRECKCILLIAGGVGITPLMSVLRYLLDRSWSGEIFLIYGCRSPEDIIYREELDYLQKRHDNLRLVITVSQSGDSEWHGPVGHITRELIVESVPDLASRYVHICGPVPMMESVKKILTELGLPADRVKTEAFGPALGKVEKIPAKSNFTGKRDELPTHIPVEVPTVTFSSSGKSTLLPPGMVVLDAAESVGVEIDYSCRTGTCGACRVKLLSGEVTMDVDEGLQPGDRENNIILACQATALRDISVEA